MILNLKMLLYFEHIHLHRFRVENNHLNEWILHEFQFFQMVVFQESENRKKELFKN